mmetsp:Transcript_15493/g.18672  ORF Transcript_15493/g.18672 Transcript_15493/m.18672 type:complete len:201 (-) Transcript_15493:780-1382(-)
MPRSKYRSWKRRMEGTSTPKTTCRLLSSTYLPTGQWLRSRLLSDPSMAFLSRAKRPSTRGRYCMTTSSLEMCPAYAGKTETRRMCALCYEAMSKDLARVPSTIRMVAAVLHLQKPARLLPVTSVSNRSSADTPRAASIQSLPFNFHGTSAKSQTWCARCTPRCRCRCSPRSRSAFSSCSISLPTTSSCRTRASCSMAPFS